MSRMLRSFLILLIAFLFIAGLMILHSAPGHGAPVCSKCGKFITGTYWNVQGQELCNDCYQKSVTRCASCGQKITGRYYTLQNGTFCQACYEKTAPRCQYCKKIPQSSYFNSGTGILCEDCFKLHGPRCRICNRLLTGKFREFPYSGKMICLECMKLYPPCKTCSAPVGPHPMEVERAFFLCPECAKIAILTREQALPFLREARKAIKDMLSLEALVPDGNLILTDSSTIRHLNEGRSEYIPIKGVAGLHEYAVGISTIYVLKGLSPGLALETIAHEYTHAWQCRHCIERQDLILREGFAEWVSYKVLLWKKDSLTADMKLREMDPVYGEGLKKTILLERDLGKKGLIEYVKSHKSFPAYLMKTPPPLQK
jgi:hypothetical protein